jgi:hypothetical protein
MGGQQGQQGYAGVKHQTSMGEGEMHQDKRQNVMNGGPPADGGMTIQQKANSISRTSATTLSQMTAARFDQLDMHPATKRALAEVLRYEFMTIVQQQSCPVGLTGVDILAKAKTGTGKTLSFLVNPKS